MKAYAILAGGGVKGAALVGALSAAQERGINFVGYGGTSAGSIVALLATVGYTAEELKPIMINELNFPDFLDDSQDELEQLKTNLEQLFQFIKETIRQGINWWNFPERIKLISKLLEAFQNLNQNLGLCDANGVKKFLLEKIGNKIPQLNNRTDITFQDLINHNCHSLKVVATDLASRKAVIYPSEEDGGYNYSVIDAVRSSMSFPFVFRPLKFNKRFLVDGGLSSNLPIFLFEQEKKQNNYPVMAFDLVVDTSSTEVTDNNDYGLLKFSGDMLSTVLEASDELFIDFAIKNTYLIRIPIAKDIGTLDFSLSQGNKERLFDRGYQCTNSYLNEVVFQAWNEAETKREKMRALFGRIDLIEKLLEKVAKEVEDYTSAKNVRAYIMLPTQETTLIAAYQYGMDDDPDIDWEIPLNSCCYGQVWLNKQPAFVEIDKMRKNLSGYNLTKIQSNKIRSDRTAIYCVPIYDIRNQSLNSKTFDNLENLAILSVDTSTPLENTLWLEENSRIDDILELWADTLSYVLS